MDPFEHLPEAPDLNGAIVVVSYKPVFVGPYSCIYRGTLRYNGEMVLVHIIQAPVSGPHVYQVAIKVLNAVEGTALHTMRRVSHIKFDFSRAHICVETKSRTTNMGSVEPSQHSSLIWLCG